MRSKINCLQCGKEVAPYYGGKLQKYCSLKCETKYKWRLKHPFTPIVKKCLFCDKEFIKRRCGKPHIYCSLSCCRKHWRKLNPEKNSLIQKKVYAKNRLNPNKRFYEIKYQANKRKHKFELTKDEFMSFWNKKCFYCGDIVEGVGVDRVDNFKGYSMDNTVSCCTECNKMKMTKTIDEFLQKCKQIVEYKK